jgi:predicted GNAT family acetyltransferase
MTDGAFVLEDSDLTDLLSLLDTAPAQHVFVRSRVAGGIERLGHPVWGWREGGILRSALFLGPNLVPIELNDNSLAAFTHLLAVRDRNCASIVGERSEVEQLWREMHLVWGPARLVRESQPYLALDHYLPVSSSEVRRIQLPDLDSYVVASSSMFAAEVGVDPNQLNATGYRLRVQETIREGRAYGLVDEFGFTRFKTDVGCITDDFCQIQGVWLHPDWRGQGKAAALLSAAVAQIQQDFSRGVCLYVNDFNRPALATYARLGFTPIAEFSTIFF